MDEARWRQIESLYHAALDKLPEERADFLAQKCGADKELCGEVYSLLSSHEQSDEFLNEPYFDLGLKILAKPEQVLQSEQILGNYKILSLLGRGGMGEVYLAQDQRLGRLVALKVLPSEVSANSERIRRFLLEARAASALNHPNILTIYEIGEAQDLSFIVSEFVEGESLRRKLKREKQIALPEFQEIALQIAAALNAAHKVGIIHRDVKPENVMLREDGLVKVLDFGLAKLTESHAEKFSDKDFFTTQPGMVLGTVSYMSPEQVRGQKVDARSDIWSFGVVLYEMLTGRLPFAGETTSDITAEILTSEPPPFDAGSTETESALRQIIQTALRKNPAERYQTVVETADELRKSRVEADQIFRQTGESNINRNFATDSKRVLTSAAVSPFQTVTGAFKSAGTGTYIAFAAILIVILGGIYTVYRFANGSSWFSSEPLKMSRISDSGKTVTAAISPDGKYVVQAITDAGKESIWIKHLATNSNVQLVAPKETDYPALTFSKDGSYIYYVQNNGELYQVPVLGGEPRKISGRIHSAVSFSPDGSQFTFIRRLPEDQTALIIANADGTGERQMAARAKPDFFVGPAWSPDGKTIAVSAGHSSSDPLASLVAISVEGGTEHTLSAQKWRAILQPTWLSDGSGVIAPAISDSANNDALQIWFFPASVGEVRRITNDFSNYGDVSLTADSSAMVTIRFEQRTNIWHLPQGKTEQARMVSNNVHSLYRFVVSAPDGRIIYPSEEDSGKNRNIWIMNADGSNSKQLTANAGDNILPCVTADGRHIIFTSNRADMKTYHLWRMNMDGTDPAQLTNGADGERGPACAPDGRTVFYSSGGPDVGINKSRLWKTSVEGAEAVQVADYPVNWKDVSPDGKFIAFRFKPNESSPVKLGIIPIEGGQPVKVFDTKENSQIRWTPDGGAVSYIKGEKDFSNIWIQSVSGEPARQLTKFTAELIMFFDWTKNGDLICTRGYQARDPVLISNFK